MAGNHIPGTAKEIIEKLMAENNLTINQLAKKLGVCNSTIYRIKQGIKPLPRTHFNLIQLYISVEELSNKIDT